MKIGQFRVGLSKGARNTVFQSYHILCIVFLIPFFSGKDEIDAGNENIPSSVDSKGDEVDHDEIQEVKSDGCGSAKAKMGFHLMSITCHRGHFIDTVEVWWD